MSDGLAQDPPQQVVSFMYINSYTLRTVVSSKPVASWGLQLVLQTPVFLLHKPCKSLVGQEICPKLRQVQLDEAASSFRAFLASTVAHTC